MPKWFEIFKASAGCTKIMLYDEIGMFGVTAKDFCNELNAIKTSKISVHINSGGGEVFDAFAIYSAIKAHDAEVTCCVDGLAASAASVIAMAGDKVRMARNSFMMMHNVSTMAYGDSSDLRKSADLVDKLSQSVAKAYADKSGKSMEDVLAAMNEETWYDADEAKKWGLIDEISDDEGDENGMALAAKFCINKYQKAPPALRKFAAKLAVKPKPEPERDIPMDKIEFRDGKYFIGDKEVDGSSVPVPSNEAAISKAANDAVEKERAYRSMFNTIVETAKLSGDAAKNFEKDFYGRAESDLKFLASHAIGQRAKPVGEGAPGNGEGDKDPNSKDGDKVSADAKKRWNEDGKLRRMHGCITQNPDDAQYVHCMNRYVRAVVKNAKDVKVAGKFDQVQDDDAISAALANKGMLVYE